MHFIKSIAAFIIITILFNSYASGQGCSFTPYPVTYNGPVSAGSNLVSNAGFETGDFSNWFNDPNEDAAMTASAKRSGNYGLRAYAGPFKFKTQQQIIDLEPNTSYELKFWMRSYAGSPSVAVYLWFLDNNGNWQTFGNNYSPNSSWQEYIIPITTPLECASSYQIRIEIARYSNAGVHMDDIEIIATGNEFSALNYSTPPVQTDVFFEDFDNAEGGTILNPQKWTVISKQWSSGHAGPNHGVVPENLELTGNSILFKGHGDNYTGSVEGFGGNTRVGSVIATKDYYASGSYEVRAKLAPVGVCTAFWTYHYIEDEYNSGSPGTEIKNTEIDWEFPGDNLGPNSLDKARCNTWGGLCNGWTGEYSARGDLFVSPTVNSVADLMNSYHVYRIDWHTGGGGETPRIEWYIDDVLVEYYDHDKISGDDDNVGFRATRFWVGVWYSSWSGLPDHDEVNCEVDWVRITPFNEPNDVYENESFPDDGIATTCRYPLYPNQPPTAEFTKDKTSICSGETITYTSTSTGLIDTYAWDFGAGATPATATGIGPHSVTYSTTGNKNITLDVTGPGGTDSEVKNSFITVDGTVSPTISITQTAGTNPSCAGDNLTYTATITNGGATPSYQWKVNGSNVGTNSSTYSTTSLNDQDVVSVELTSSSTCASPTTASSNDITHEISGTPSATISISLNSTPTCSSDQFDFTSSVTGDPVDSYSWFVNNTPIGNTTDSYSDVGLVNGDEVYLEGYINACSSTQTYSSNIITISGIQATTAPTISISQTTGTNPSCTGENLTYTATISNGGATPSYQWKVNSGNVGTDASTYSSSTLNDQDIISVELTSSNACASPSTVSSNDITQGIDSNPTTSISISTDAPPTCNGQQIDFSSVVTGSPVNGYLWYVNNSSTGITTNTFSNSTLVNGDQVYLEGTVNTCSSTQTFTSNTITISGLQNAVTPSVSIALTTGTNPSCAGENLTYTATSNNGGTTPSYQWKVNGSNVGTDASTYSSSTLNDQDIISVELTSSNPCASPSVATSNSITQEIDNSSSATSITITADNNPSCEGSTVNISSTSTGSTINSYSWFLNNSSTGNTSSSLNSNALITGDEVYLQGNTTSCGSPQTITSNTITIQRTSPPTSNPITGPDAVACNINGQVYSVNNNSGSIYNWNVSQEATLVSGQGSNSIIVDFGNENTVITVAESSAPTCVGPTHAKLVDVCVTGTNNMELESIHFAPNPFNQTGVLTTTNSFIGYNIQVVDLTGRVIPTLYNIEGNQIIIGNDLKSGLYILHVFNQEESRSFKIIKN